MTSLQGRTILITRASDDAPAWAKAFEQVGARTVIFPCLETEPIVDEHTRATLIRVVTAARWVAFTSRRGVRATANLLNGNMPADVSIAAVGESTAAEARIHFGRCDLVGGGTGAALGNALAGVDSGPVALPVAASGRHDVEAVLDQAGIQVDRVPVYRTVPAPESRPRQDLSALGVDTVVLASPSAVEGLLHRATVPSDVRVITIGPVTTDAAYAAGLAVTAQAAEPNLDAIMEAIP